MNTPHTPVRRRALPVLAASLVLLAPFGLVGCGGSDSGGNTPGAVSQGAERRLLPLSMTTELLALPHLAQRGRARPRGHHRGQRAAGPAPGAGRRHRQHPPLQQPRLRAHRARGDPRQQPRPQGAARRLPQPHHGADGRGRQHRRARGLHRAGQRVPQHRRGRQRGQRDHGRVVHAQDPRARHGALHQEGARRRHAARDDQRQLPVLAVGAPGHRAGGGLRRGARLPLPRHLLQPHGLRLAEGRARGAACAGHGRRRRGRGQVAAGARAQRPGQPEPGLDPAGHRRDGLGGGRHRGRPQPGLPRAPGQPAHVLRGHAALGPGGPRRPAGPEGGLLLPGLRRTLEAGRRRLGPVQRQPPGALRGAGPGRWPRPSPPAATRCSPTP